MMNLHWPEKTDLQIIVCIVCEASIHELVMRTNCQGWNYITYQTFTDAQNKNKTLSQGSNTLVNQSTCLDVLTSNRLRNIII